MHFQKFYLIVVFCLTGAIPSKEESPFFKYNLKGLKESDYYGTCLNPEFYIKTADIEESKPSNQDKIILYHGETYGAWIYQMLWRAFLYLEAPDDWLPLRFEKLKFDIDKTTLLRLITPSTSDHNEEFTKVGLSVTPNLYSKYGSESAWGPICRRPFSKWHKVSGYSDLFYRRHQQLYNLLKEKFIPNDQWPKFKRQKKLLNFFIQEKRRQEQKITIPNFIETAKEYFPKTFERFSREFHSLLNNKEKENRKGDYIEGVALQIIMDKKLANHLTYESHPFGKLKKELSESLIQGTYWNGEKIKPFSEFYEEVKNKEDLEQARLALNNDFRQYPSRVRINAIAGIMENEVDYEIVKSMIREMVEFRKHLCVSNNKNRNSCWGFFEW